MFRVDPRKLPTLILALEPISNPLGLMTQTAPSAVICPNIREGSAPVTRFKDIQLVS